MQKHQRRNPAHEEGTSRGLLPHLHSLDLAGPGWVAVPRRRPRREPIGHRGHRQRGRGYSLGLHCCTLLGGDQGQGLFCVLFSSLFDSQVAHGF